MSSRKNPPNNAIRQAKRRQVQVPKSWTQQGRRTHFGNRTLREPFAPPEDWHEPTGAEEDYRIIVQPAGHGYRHVLTPEQIRKRLAQLPSSFVSTLEVVQLSRMTEKNQWHETVRLEEAIIGSLSILNLFRTR